MTLKEAIDAVYREFYIQDDEIDFWEWLAKNKKESDEHAALVDNLDIAARANLNLAQGLEDYKNGMLNLIQRFWNRNNDSEKAKLRSMLKAREEKREMKNSKNAALNFFASLD